MSLTDTSRRTLLKVTGLATAAIAGGGVASVAADEGDDEGDGNESNGEGEDEEEGNEEEEKEEEAEVKFEKQTVEAAGTPTVYVEEVKVPDAGWIVIHNWGTDGMSGDDNPAQNFIGVSAYLEAGEYENLPVELGGDVPASVPDDGDTYTVSAMAHRDDPDNRTFDFPDEVDDGEKPDDPPYMDEDGNIVQTFADVTFEEE